MNQKLVINLIALVLLCLFFAPYIIKLQQVDLLVVLLGGLALPIYDFFNSKKDSSK